MEDKRIALVIYHMKQILIIFGEPCNPEDDEKILLSRINQHYQVHGFSWITEYHNFLESPPKVVDIQPQVEQKASEIKDFLKLSTDVISNFSPNQIDNELTREAKCSPMREGDYSCDICHKILKSKQSLEHHLKSHSGVKSNLCKICNAAFTTKQNLRSHMRSHTGEKPFECNVCQKAFRDKKRLIVHTRVHTGERPYPCKLCDKKFMDHRGLKDHTRLHTGEKPFSCDICGKKFAVKCGLKTHILNHSEEKQYSCDICDKSFFSLTVLKRHKVTHGPNREKVDCNICSLKVIKCNLERHIMVAHKNKGEYACFFCEKRFSCKTGLKIHEQGHTGERYFCNLCDKSFNMKLKLTRHQSKDCVISCDKCDKSFKLKANLKKHQKVNCLDEKLFPCDLCDNVYLSQDNLTRHKIEHDGIKCDLCHEVLPTKISLSRHIKKTCMGKKEEIKVEDSNTSSIKVEVEDFKEHYVETFETFNDPLDVKDFTELHK